MSTTDRLHALDAVRGFALLLGVVFHAGFSFLPGMIPGIWAIVDTSPSTAISVLIFTSHIFRMSLFFFIAGFFARMMLQRKGAARLLVRPGQADPGADARRVGGALSRHRRRVGVGPVEDVRRWTAARAAGRSATAAASARFR